MRRRWGRRRRRRVGRAGARAGGGGVGGGRGGGSARAWHRDTHPALRRRDLRQEGHQRLDEVDDANCASGARGGEGARLAVARGTAARGCRLRWHPGAGGLTRLAKARTHLGNSRGPLGEARSARPAQSPGAEGEGGPLRKCARGAWESDTVCGRAVGSSWHRAAIRNQSSRSRVSLSLLLPAPPPGGRRRGRRRSRGRRALRPWTPLSVRR